jgi:hypothetical protein
MCIEERNIISRRGFISCPLSSPQGVMVVEVTKQNMINKSVKERMVKQRKYVRSVRGSREKIRNNRIIGKIGNKRARANRPVDIMDHNISSSLHKAFEPQNAIIRAWEIPRPRAWINRFTNEKTNSGIFNTRRK